jgi:GNAT superfamily N-acetyltransferase
MCTTANGDCVVRPAARREIPEIESLGVAAYAQYRDAVSAAVFDAYMRDLRRLADYWDEATVLVAELDDRIAGSVLFYADASSEGLGLPADWAGFRKLAVRPEMRGRAVGRELVQRCVDRARRLGAPAIGIHTSSFMKVACRLYERAGFRRHPRFDRAASELLGVAAGRELRLLAYRLDLDRPHEPGAHA